ncbi:type II toxin-antitoxin system RelE/ParE family toxin [Pontiella sp.]|uniref:type II toxin-antitoxin system RelE/ParE family toxin n=1 Tax=Pontiella sp. TaxID=2837462 RepID=UPI0035651156
MADLIWTEPALLDLDEVAEYIALDNPAAASDFVQKVFDRTNRLTLYPNSGKRPKELPRTPYREIVIPPCRIFYRVENDVAYILHVMRSERLLQPFLIDRRDRDK